MGDKAASLVLAWIDLEILFRAAETKQDFGDGAVALSTKARVERTQGQDVPLPELLGQRAKIRTGRSTFEGPPKSPGSVNAQVVEVVHRQDCSIESRGVGNGVGQPELVRNAVDLPDAVPTVRGLAQVKAVEMRQRDDRLHHAGEMLHGREPYGPRLKARIPEQRLPIGWGFRISRKIAAPSAVRTLPAAPGPVWTTR